MYIYFFTENHAYKFELKNFGSNEAQRFEGNLNIKKRYFIC
jgi:hypothetical protein